ncbi:type IV secretion system protein VirB10 [Phenylobacterium sp.]|uniref:type IV secretion system protein VirB10 n=1 Tax=Phenylobacterium sp. TaxID=1871053 RepID=UPI0025E4CC38|nr:type IV secretion system protein VirB10 [Phenylobacterium sp.]MBX3483723.1 type IV secretion system protein VirB10 [Phenylobacterium sp.]MCW5758139.1 type IV secretion system protein VirB10 [Phenylobacterium sp.]
MSGRTPQKTPQGVSPVFARGEARTPRVRAPNSPVTLWAGLGGAAILGFMVFNGLSSGRTAHAQAQPTATERPVVAPAAAPTPAPPPPVVQPQPAPTSLVPQPLPPAPNPNDAHWRAPAMVVDFSASPDAAPIQLAQAAGPAAVAAVPPSNEARETSDERFAARVIGASGDVAHAGQMRDLGRTVPQGTVIAAVLETAINSDLPGSVRGVVSRDVRSFDGSRVLIPRGSRLVGQYKSAAAIGQTRAFVVWSRIISPTGVTIDVGSPGTDRLGRGGLDGEVDTHFFRRFGASILLSVVSAGSQALANSATNGNNTTFVIASPAQANQVASIALQKQMDIPDTIKVAQGVPVQVFVARDLDFSAVVR